MTRAKSYNISITKFYVRDIWTCDEYYDSYNVIIDLFESKNQKKCLSNAKTLFYFKKDNFYHIGYINYK